MQEKEKAFFGYQDLETYFSIGHQTIRKWIKQGKFPPGMKMGKTVVWPKEVIEMVGDKMKASYYEKNCK